MKNGLITQIEAQYKPIIAYLEAAFGKEWISKKYTENGDNILYELLVVCPLPNNRCAVKAFPTRFFGQKEIEAFHNREFAYLKQLKRDVRCFVNECVRENEEG